MVQQRQANSQGDSSVDALQRLEAGEGTPLISGEVPLPALPEGASLSEKVVFGTAGVGFVSNALSLILSPHVTVMCSSALGMLLAPFCAFQQKKITQARALKKTNEVMQEEVVKLHRENDRLQEQEKDMSASVLKLQEHEKSLEEIRALGGASLEELERQLVESKKILKGYQQNHKTELLQNLMTVMLTMDRDGNMILSNEEIDELIQALEGIHGVQLQEDKLRKIIIDQGRSLMGVMDLARNLLLGEDNDDAIFSIIEEESAL